MGVRAVPYTQVVDAGCYSAVGVDVAFPICWG